MHRWGGRFCLDATANCRWLDARACKTSIKDSTLLNAQVTALLKQATEGTNEFRADKVNWHGFRYGTNLGNLKTKTNIAELALVRCWGVYIRCGTREFRFQSIGEILMWYRIWMAKKKIIHLASNDGCFNTSLWSRIPRRYRILDAMTGQHIAKLVLFCMLQNGFRLNGE